MPVVTRSIVVDAPLSVAFQLSNQLEQWPKLMEDYAEVEILGQEGAKTWFRLTDAEGRRWVSWRVIHPDGHFALAERHEPLGPFRFMQHAWTYRELGPERTVMTWEMNFELSDAERARESEAAGWLSERTQRNQASMKAGIERQYRDQGAAR